jgi:hypothetical protein
MKTLCLFSQPEVSSPVSADRPICVLARACRPLLRHLPCGIELDRCIGLERLIEHGTERQQRARKTFSS